MQRWRWFICTLAGLSFAVGCGGTSPVTDAGNESPVDSGVDAGTVGEDAGFDAGLDAGEDAGIDAGFDAGEQDAGECSPGSVRFCYDGGTDTLDAGICRPGTQTCGSDSTWALACSGEQLPQAESCNGLDDDCNGAVDDVSPSSITCGMGACVRTVPACSNGQAGVCTPGPSSPESCNGLDDDCDGVIDNGTGNSLCAAKSQTSSLACSNGSCSITQCNAGFADVNGVYSDGCECQEDAWSAVCGTATSMGSVGVGSSVTRSGRLTKATSEDWFVFTVPSQTGTVSVTMSGVPGFVFDAQTSCGSGPISCTSGTATTAQGLTTLKIGAANSGANSCGAAWPGSTIYVRVRLAGAAPTCNNYTLTVSH